MPALMIARALGGKQLPTLRTSLANRCGEMRPPAWPAAARAPRAAKQPRSRQDRRHGSSDAVGILQPPPLFRASGVSCRPKRLQLPRFSKPTTQLCRFTPRRPVRSPCPIRAGMRACGGYRIEAVDPLFMTQGCWVIYVGPSPQRPGRSRARCWRAGYGGLARACGPPPAGLSIGPRNWERSG
jgi:hypothetical protein